MNSRDFIIKTLNNIVENYSNIQFEYKLNNTTITHTIKVSPKEIYNNDETYMNIESSFETIFERLFPSENILFISEDSLIDIETPELVFKSNRINLPQEKNNITSSTSIRGKVAENKIYNKYNYALAA